MKELDKEKLFIAVAESTLKTSQILKLAKITHTTWVRACNGQPIRPQTAGRIARALNVTVKSLLP